MITDILGLQPSDAARITDNSIDTCSDFATDSPQYTQMFLQSNCSKDQMSVTLVGQDMKCDSNIYVVGLKGADVGKTLNKWKICKLRWQTTTSESVDWCFYECHCDGGCEQIMLLRWPKSLTDNSWRLCEIYQHCKGQQPELPSPRIDAFSLILSAIKLKFFIQPCAERFAQDLSFVSFLSATVSLNLNFFFLFYIKVSARIRVHATYTAAEAGMKDISFVSCSIRTDA